MVCKRFDTKWKVDAQQECIDFVRNGYQVVYSSFTDERWTVRFKHQCNGNKLFVHASAKAVRIVVNGNCVKSISYSPTKALGSFSRISGSFKKL